MLAFAMAVALRLHGFSISAWHPLIDGSAPAELLAGEPRDIRGDDFLVQLPLILAQRAHAPPFPMRNDLIGAGQSALVPIGTPVWHPFALFRPTLWGFFLGADVGLAWMWWSSVLGLFAVWWGVFQVATRGATGIAAAGAALVVASPFFEFWSFNAAPHAASAGAVFLATAGLLSARSRVAIVACGLALAASGLWFALALYPPYQVMLVYLDLALVAGYWWDRRSELPLHSHRGIRLLAFAAAPMLVLGGVGLFAHETGAALDRMQHSQYPGLRLSAGGHRSLAQLLDANLGVGLWVRDWARFGNICEAASFWVAAPVLLAMAVWRRVRERAPFDAFCIPVALYWMGALTYSVHGMPAKLASLTLLGFVPGRRAVIGLLLADAILVVRLLARAPPAGSGERSRALAISAAWAAGVGAAAAALRPELPDARLIVLAAFVAGNGLLAWLLLASRRRALAVLALACVSFATSAWFNPLVVGGTDWLLGNPLSRRIVEIDRATEGGSTWCVFAHGSAGVANLFRVLGVRSVTGVLPVPQPELWARIDPEAKWAAVYNRYAHVWFEAAPTPEPRFRLVAEDGFIVEIDPTSQALRDLGVTHALLKGGDPGSFALESGFVYLGTVGQNHLFRVPPLPGRSDPGVKPSPRADF